MLNDEQQNYQETMITLENVVYLKKPVNSTDNGHIHDEYAAFVLSVSAKSLTNGKTYKLKAKQLLKDGFGEEIIIRRKSPLVRNNCFKVRELKNFVYEGISTMDMIIGEYGGEVSPSTSMGLPKPYQTDTLEKPKAYPVSTYLQEVQELTERSKQKAMDQGYIPFK